MLANEKAEVMQKIAKQSKTNIKEFVHNIDKMSKHLEGEIRLLQSRKVQQEVAYSMLLSPCPKEYKLFYRQVLKQRKSNRDKIAMAHGHRSSSATAGSAGYDQQKADAGHLGSPFAQRGPQLSISGPNGGGGGGASHRHHFLPNFLAFSISFVAHL